MLAGILILVLVIAGLAVGLPWVLDATSHDPQGDEDPAERFAQSMRVLRGDAPEIVEPVDAAAVSTPLTRRAQLAELRLIQRSAARWRAMIMTGLVATAVVFALLAALNVFSWWALIIPGGLLLAFIPVARISVVVMQRDLDRRTAEIRGGFSEDEPTMVLALGEENSFSVEFSVDLSAPTTTGAIWDPIPVTGPGNYMSKPLMPRTVRTIDLSAPVVPATPPIPTADNPHETGEEQEDEATQTDSVVPFRPPAIGE